MKEGKDGNYQVKKTNKEFLMHNVSNKPCQSSTDLHQMIEVIILYIYIIRSGRTFLFNLLVPYR